LNEESGSCFAGGEKQIGIGGASCQQAEGAGRGQQMCADEQVTDSVTQVPACDDDAADFKQSSETTHPERTH
jgi:hypothetical protein